VSSFEEAQAICRRNKLNLVSIDNKELQAFLYKNVTAKLKEKGCIFPSTQVCNDPRFVIVGISNFTAWTSLRRNEFLPEAMHWFTGPLSPTKLNMTDLNRGCGVLTVKNVSLQNCDAILGMPLCDNSTFS
jgi:rRNA pseudouridine-1189 N-methylase Emg1 (Nep1/Mra1 family)